MSKTAFFLLSLSYLGCASSSAKPAESEAHEEHGEHGEHHEHEAMSPGLKSFHDVLAPIYHDAKGAPRNDKACAAAGTFKEKAAGLGDNLVGAVAALETACAAEGKPDVEAKLEKVHDAFHAAMEGK